jgi:transcriptional regulator
VYEPPLHIQSDVAALYALIRAHPLGLLISHGSSGLLANAIPFILDAEAAPRPILRAHLARANSQLRDLAEASEALVVFQGVDHYVSPSWYATKAETHKVVPTWNYLIVQARGKPRVIDEAPWLRAQIEALTASQESHKAAPWAVGDAPPDFIAQQMRAIVGLEIEVADIRGKWKASQNRNEADRAGVVAGLEAEGSETALAMAKVVAGRGEPGL